MENELGNPDLSGVFPIKVKPLKNQAKNIPWPWFY